MKKKRFSIEQIVAVLKQAELRMPVAKLIRQELGIRLNPRYLNAWLRDRGFTPQKPQRVARERDPAAIAAWLASDWPRIPKRRDDEAPRSP